MENKRLVKNLTGENQTELAESRRKLIKATQTGLHWAAFFMVVQLIAIAWILITMRDVDFWICAPWLGSSILLFCLSLFGYFYFNIKAAKAIKDDAMGHVDFRTKIFDLARLHELGLCSDEEFNDTLKEIKARYNADVDLEIQHVKVKTSWKQSEIELEEAKRRAQQMKEKLEQYKLK